MNDVDVVGVVEGQKGALDHVAVADGSGDEVSEARGGGGRRETGVGWSFDSTKMEGLE